MKRTSLIASTVVALLAFTANAQTKKPLSPAEQAKLDRYNEVYNRELDARLKSGMDFKTAEKEAFSIGEQAYKEKPAAVAPKAPAKPAVAKPAVKPASAPVAAEAPKNPSISSSVSSSKTSAPADRPSQSESTARADVNAPKTKPTLGESQGWVNPPDKKTEAPATSTEQPRAWVDVPEKKAGDSDKMKAAILMKERAEAKLVEVTSCKEKLTNAARIDKLTGARTLITEAKSMVPSLDIAKLDGDLGTAMSASTQKEDYCDRVTRLKNEAAEKKAAESGVDRKNVKVIYAAPTYNQSYTPAGKKGVAGSTTID